MAIETTPESTKLMKRGETVIQATLHRNTSGLSISVKVHPNVEEFFRGLCTGEQSDVRRYGRYWTPLEKEGVLRIYEVPGLGPTPLGNGHTYRLDRPGHPLLEGDTGQITPKGIYAESINLSWLRLVGASEGAGITFRVNGVHTVETARKIRDMIGEAAQAFYVNYLRPVDLDVQISTQDIPR